MIMSNELFTTKPVNIEMLGPYLKQVREQLNFDIKTASILTQIKPRYLESLEAGQWHELPSDVYIRGFIKSLARVYNLPEDNLIEQYEKEHGFTPQARPAKIQNKTKINFTPKTIIVLVSLFLGLLAAGYVANQINSVLAPPYLELNEPEDGAAIQGNSLVVAGQVEVGADVTINQQIVLTDRNGQFTESLVLSPGVNTIEVIARNKFDRESRVVRRVNAEIPQTGDEQPEAAPVRVTIEVGPESAWIYMEADGVVVQRGTMLPGATKTITAQNDVLLTSANAGATRVIYNGTDLGVMGRSGEVVRNVEFAAPTAE
jgi:cytoskeletal protein RodZ